MAYAFQKFELGFVGGKDCVVVKTGDWKSQDCMGFVVVDDEETHIPFKGHVWEQPGKIVIQYFCLLIRKRAETENVSNGAVLVFDDDIWTIHGWFDIDPWFR